MSSPSNLNTPLHHMTTTQNLVDELASSEVVDDMVTADTNRVLIIYTGGTIGMKNVPSQGYLPVADYLPHLLSTMTMFHDKSVFQYDDTSTDKVNTNQVNIVLKYPFQDEYKEFMKQKQHVTINGAPIKRISRPALITPQSLYGKRTRYSIIEYDPLLDSSNLVMEDWIKIATDIEVNYQLFDAFIILHGTDTMGYTSSALSFMLEHLGKTVILTGSQVPLAEIRNDGIDNLLGALTIAGHFIIPEVGLYFSHKLFRGNRSYKIDAMDFDAFGSPNMKPLVNVGIDINVAWQDVFKPTFISKFKVHKVLDSNVAVLRIFPGITSATVRAFLTSSVKGVVLQTYGAGNVPANRSDILSALKEACENGVVIVNISQCSKGTVSDAYATGKVLYDCGVVSGKDMTPECALTKLSYLLGKGYSPEKCRQEMSNNLRGELTIHSKKKRFTYQFSTQNLVHGVFNMLNGNPINAQQPKRFGNSNESGDDNSSPSSLNSGDDSPTKNGKFEFGELEKTLVPMMLCYAARVGDLDGIQSIITEFGNLVNIVDYDCRTPLHIACHEGKQSVAEYLVQNGANVHLRDRFGHGPLWDAAKSRNNTIVHLLRKTGAHFSEQEVEEVTALLLSSATNGDLEMVKVLKSCGVDFNCTTWDDRTALHLATCYNRVSVVEYIVKCAIGLDGKVGFEDEVNEKLRLLDSKVDAVDGDSHHRGGGGGGVSMSKTRSNDLLSPTSDISRVSSVDSLRLSGHYINLKPVDRFGSTPLQNATEKGFDEIARIIRHGIENTKFF